MGPPSTTTVLLLESGTPGPGLAQTREFKRVREALEGTDHGRGYRVHLEHAVEATRLIDLVAGYKPTIVHFSGHTNEAGELVFSRPDGSVQAADVDSISWVFGQLSRSVRCVVLNACDSIHQAEDIAVHIDVVIAHRGRIQDEAAIEFAVGFYRALGRGECFETAFECGRTQIGVEGRPDRDVPQMFAKPGARTAGLPVAPVEDEVARPEPPTAPVEDEVARPEPPARRRGRPGLLRLAVLGFAVAGGVMFLDDPSVAPRASLAGVRVDRPLDEKGACNQGDEGACAKLGARFAADGEVRKANYYYQRACDHGDEVSCRTLAPSPDEICTHTMGLLARSPAVQTVDTGVSRSLQQSCASELVEQAQSRGRIAYERYAKCIVDSRDHAAYVRCRDAFARVRP